MPSRFVRPEVRTLKLSNDDRLIVRARLSAGELRAKLNRMYTASDDGTLHVNRLQVRLAQISAYLLDWSLVDDNAPVVIKDLSVAQLEAVLDRLDPESFSEIADAIDAHELAMAAEREAEKKTTAGTPASAWTSPSLAAVAGGTNG